MTTRSIDEWEQACSSAFVPLGVDSAAPRFSASLDDLELGRGLSITRVASGGSKVHRGPRTIAQHPRDDVLVALHTGGRGRVLQHGRKAELTRGSMTLYDTSAPYALDFPASMSEIVLQVPRKVLAGSSRTLQETTARVVPESASLTALKALLLATAPDAESADANSPEPRPRDRAEDALIGEAAITLLHGALLTPGETGPASIPPQTLSTVLREYADQHLDDADLDVSTLAAAHHVSVRQVHQVFAQEGDTPARYIEDRRLTRAYTLIAAGMATAPAAARCGYRDPSTLSRAFRRRYGLTPAALRAELSSEQSSAP